MSLFPPRLCHYPFPTLGRPKMDCMQRAPSGFSATTAYLFNCYIGQDIQSDIPSTY